MIAILSPSKTLIEHHRRVTDVFTVPEFLAVAKKLARQMQRLSPAALQELLEINRELADLTFRRYMEWTRPLSPENDVQALLMFRGEVFNGLKAETLGADDLLYAQDHLRILSGLYGILRPLDLVKPYRLEMRTRLNVGKQPDLYAFWGDRTTRALKNALDGHAERVLLNLASQEYFRAVNTGRLNARVVTCHFREERNGAYQFITVYGKNARGAMTRFILRNRIEKADDLRAFDEDGYYFNARLSGEDEWYFTRQGRQTDS